MTYARDLRVLKEELAAQQLAMSIVLGQTVHYVAPSTAYAERVFKRTQEILAEMKHG